MKKEYRIEDYGALFDAHVHTYFDYHDGMITPRQLIRFTKKKGLNFVNAMAHDTIRGVKKIKKLAKENGLPCISAMEVSTTYNHILAFGVNDWPFQRNTLDPDVAIDYLRQQGCAIFLAHPYADAHDGLWTPEIVKRLDIDGIEWTNATSYFHNRKTHQIYKRFPKGRRIAGSDAHTTAVFGSAFTQVAVNSKDPDDLVSNMKKGKCKAYSSIAPIHRAAFMAFKAITWNKVVKLRRIEGRTVIPHGDHPGSIIPDTIHTSKEWKNLILNKPEIKRNVRWIDGV